MVLQYKCPSCGADMVFKSETGLLTCESCGLTQQIEQMEKPDLTPKGEPDPNEIPAQEYSDYEDSTNYNTFEEGQDTREYQCNNCGAVLQTNADTSATTCSFCGAAMVLSDRLSGSLAPNQIIPFTISKEQAQEAFKKWCKKGLLTPAGFMNADRIKNISGMYVPFWLYDLNGRGEIHATCTKVHHYTRGGYEYTETSYFDVYRKVDLNYNQIPADASEKMDDEMMDKLEPFQYEALKEFNTPYLAGYTAEKYNYTDKDMFPRLETRTKDYVSSYIDGTLIGYSSTHFDHKWIDIRQRKAVYTLMPVWMICYDYEHAEHNFYMNGQTGKIVGKPPLSKGKITLWFFLIFLIASGVLKAVGLLLGGGWI